MQNNSKLENINSIFATANIRNNNEIKKYEIIYTRTMMILQNNLILLHRQKQEIKHRNILIKLKNMEINKSEDWRRKWKLISQMATINLDFKHNFLVIDHNPYES